jgi:hypothetical protein
MYDVMLLEMTVLEIYTSGERQLSNVCHYKGE